MKTTLKLEEFGMLVFGIWLFSLLNYQWWWFLVLILSPDFSMIGYAFGNKTGAFSYNLFHHRGLAILLYILGVYWNIELLSLIGTILFSHASFDRIFGYGLKYENGFQFTHLGKIGKEQS